MNEGLRCQLSNWSCRCRLNALILPVHNNQKNALMLHFPVNEVTTLWNRAKFGSINDQLSKVFPLSSSGLRALLSAHGPLRALE
jgi:hypothetical protein